MANHKHRDVIVAWAEGKQIQCKTVGDWEDLTVKDPMWLSINEYRVKPDMVYPRSRLTPSELAKIVNPDTPNIVHDQLISTCARVANAALRHAIDVGQLVDPSTYMADVRELAAKRNVRRDMAIAEAVIAHCNTISRGFGVGLNFNESGIAAIIATVKD